MLNQYYWDSCKADEAICAAFAAGKAVLAESDTVWGLFTPATATGAILLDQLKKRRDKPYLVIMESLAEVQKVVLFAQNGSYELAHKGWPGPLTLLLIAEKDTLLDAQSAVGVVGVRVPDHEPLRRLAGLYGGLFSTSANISGEPVPLTYEQIDTNIKNSVGAVIYNNRSYKATLLPSTIVDCTGPELKLIRKGAYIL